MQLLKAEEDERNAKTGRQKAEQNSFAEERRRFGFV